MGISYLTQRGGDKYKSFKSSINHTISGYISSIKLNGATKIRDSAFNSCVYLVSIDLPDSITSIGSYAFNSCTSLTNINLPSSITSIGSNAFNECSSLTSVILMASAPPTLGYNAFYNTNDNFIIYVPAESVDTYKSASGWSSYATKIQAIPED